MLGLSFLLTHLVLMYSSKHESRSHLTLYFVLSISTLLLYWAWFVYLKYAVGESEASKEVRFNNGVLFIYSDTVGGRYCLFYNHSIIYMHQIMWCIDCSKQRELFKLASVIYVGIQGTFATVHFSLISLGKFKKFPYISAPVLKPRMNIFLNSLNITWWWVLSIPFCELACKT